MEAQGNDVIQQALQLDDEARASLAVKLIQSLDSDEGLTRAQVEALWLKEADKRLARMESGEDPGIDARSAIQAARNNLRK